MLAAPGPVDRAPSLPAHGLDDPAILTKVLNGAGDLDVDNARFITDRSLLVDVACRPAHVTARPGPLASAEDPLGPRQIESVKLTGVAAQPHHAAGSSRISSVQPSAANRSGRNAFPGPVAIHGMLSVSNGRASR